jgi:hypothetical protein
MESGKSRKRRRRPAIASLSGTIGSGDEHPPGRACAIPRFCTPLWRPWIRPPVSLRRCTSGSSGLSRVHAKAAASGSSRGLRKAAVAKRAGRPWRAHHVGGRSSRLGCTRSSSARRGGDGCLPCRGGCTPVAHSYRGRAPSSPALLCMSAWPLINFYWTRARRLLSGELRGWVSTLRRQ